ncbi:hypothetical protein BCD67_05935 [Oscillatoriales cyanobacterium USR001]|nr:hypothetical protein BCD67_05935 [Oscillatoriales cyanobacterium USR001]
MPQVSIQTLISTAKSGNQIISFPTDTVPALAVRPELSELIFTTKKRDREKPLILMGATPEDLWPYITGTPEELQIWQQIATSHWPGALTLVLPASPKVPPAMNPTDPTTIGIRVPNLPIAQKILQQTGPLATTSANLSGQPPLETTTEIQQKFPEVLTLETSELQTTPAASGLPSTVAKWTGNSWEILRQGAVKLEC